MFRLVTQGKNCWYVDVVRDVYIYDQYYYVMIRYDYLKTAYQGLK